MFKCETKKFCHKKITHHLCWVLSHKYLKVNFKVGTVETCSKISPTVLDRSSWQIISIVNGFQFDMIISPSKSLKRHLGRYLSSCFSTYYRTEKKRIYKNPRKYKPFEQIVSSFRTLSWLSTWLIKSSKGSVAGISTNTSANVAAENLLSNSSNDLSMEQMTNIGTENKKKKIYNFD